MMKLLVIYFQDYIHFWKSEDICNEKLAEIVSELRQINYIFKNVYLLEHINHFHLEQIK